MKTILVVGLGRFGQALVRSLNGHKVEVIAVSEEAEAVDQIKDLADHAACADVADRSVLENFCQNGVDIAVVAISMNLGKSAMATMLLKELEVPFVVARAASDDHEHLLRKLGADRIIEPIADSADRLGRTLATPNMHEFVLVGENFAIVESAVTESMVGRTLQDLELRRRFGVNVIAVLKPGEEEESAREMLIPVPDTPLEEGYHLLVIGRTKELQTYQERGD